uniref:NADH-ubiquinone oxidoreductase chain 2 n=1 Tax=Aenasius arizonensis TaxID=2058190 RepID=A0A6B9XMG0_9HYME|nr:NADH dehydrogenase subunit 2 [Aenasius arizonensis]QHR84889.1 NADH dehydrogenase subunit 2 [Aenasius arizonensis]
MSLIFYTFFIPMLILSNFFILFTNSMFFMWMTMEINLMCFISIILSNKNINKEISMNYFLIQTLNSYIFISMSMMNYLNLNKTSCMMIILMVMFAKMGLPPFHYWYIKMVKNMNWMMFFINSNVQKFIPLMIINKMNFMNFNLMNLMIFMNLISSVYMSFLGLNMNNLKLIMSFSSIIQTSWIMIMMILNEILWMIYYLIYSLISLNIMMIFYKFNINNLIDMNIIKFNKINMFYILMLSMMSLAGLPPFIGFMNKWMMMWNLFTKISPYMIFTMIFISLINLFFYTRLIYSTLMIFFYSNNLMYKFINFKNNKILTMIILNNFMFMLIMIELI